MEAFLKLRLVSQKRMQIEMPIEEIEEPRRGSRILKWGVKFCNNVIEPKPGIRRKKKRKRKKGDQKKGGGGENSPISPSLDPRLVRAAPKFCFSEVSNIFVKNVSEMK